MVRQRALRAAISCLSRADPPATLLLNNGQSLRLYSIQSNEAGIAKLPGIDPNALSITETTTPKNLIPPEELVFWRNFTGMAH